MTDPTTVIVGFLDHHRLGCYRNVLVVVCNIAAKIGGKAKTWLGQ